MADNLELAKDSQAKTHAMLDENRYKSLVDLYDAYENPQDDQIAAALPYQLRRQFNTENGITGAAAYGINRPAIERYIGDIRTQRANADAAARQAAIDATNADIEIANGTDTPYKVTKDFSDWYKGWKTAYASTTDATKRANMVKSLSAKMQESGLPYMDVADAGADAQGKPIDPYYAYMEQFLGDGTDTSKFSQMLEVMKAAEKDRTPVEPEKKSWEQLYQEREAKRIEADRATEARRLERERLGHGIAGLAATIGDMVRASEGAPVSQRDWQRIYDNLTAQEKANVNNYQIRMAKLNEDIRADRARKEAAAAKAAADAAAMRFKAGENALDRKLKWDIANLEDKRNRYYAYLRWGQGDSGDKSKTHTLILLGNRAIQVPKSQTFTNAFNAIKEILTKDSNYVESARDTSGKFPMVSLLQSVPELETDPQAYYNRNIQAILSEHWDDLTPTAQAAIEKKLKAMQGEWVSGAPSNKRSTREEVREEDDDDAEDRLG